MAAVTLSAQLLLPTQPHNPHTQHTKPPPHTQPTDEKALHQLHTPHPKAHKPPPPPPTTPPWTNPTKPPPPPPPPPAPHTPPPPPEVTLFAPRWRSRAGSIPVGATRNSRKIENALAP